VISENILLWYYQMDPKIQTNLKLLDILSKWKFSTLLILVPEGQWHIDIILWQFCTF
jgi:hypothetical protein